MPILSLPTLRRDLGFVGKLVYADQAYNQIVGTYNEYIFDNTTSGAAKLPWGSFVQEGAGGVGTVDIIQAGGTTIGVALATEYYENDKVQGTTFEVGYEPNRPLAFVKKGAIFVLAEEDLLTTDPLFVRTVAKATPLANEAVGYGIRNDADGVDGGVADALPAANVKLLRNVTAGCVAPLFIEYPLA